MVQGSRTALAGSKPALTIRSHLFLLALAAIVPILAFAVAVSFLLIEQGNEVLHTGTLDRARAMLTAVDAELRGSIKPLEALATSRSLEAEDLPAFHTEAMRVLASQPTWASINLADATTFRQVVNTARPFGQPLQVLFDQPSAIKARDTRSPAVGSLTTGTMLRRPLPAVRVPVMRNGEVAYILTALVKPESFELLIRQQKLPDGWVIGIVDGAAKIIARVPSVPPGTAASEAFTRAIRSATEGWYRGATVEGLDTYTAHMTSSFSGWSIGLAVPASFVESRVRKTMWLLGVGAVFSVLLALLVAMRIGRRISGPVDALAATARAIGTGRVERHPVVERVREVAEVAAALETSAEAIRERQRLIEREKAALVEADRAKDQFIAMLSHELRNPLSALTAAAHLLKLAGPAGTASEHARGVIERQTRHMTRLIEDLLDINRVSMGKATLVRETLDLSELVRQTLRTWTDSGRTGRHVIELHASSVVVDADRSRLEQVFSNLLDNALKFTPAGGKIAVTVRQEGSEAVLRVGDEGEGIEPALLETVFGLFVQGSQELDRQNGGLGVGLALVKGLMELHGGSVSATSEGPGKGACFTVRLPAIGVSALRSPPPSPGASARHETPRNILIVEDNTDARHMLRAMLELKGHRVREATSGAAGLAQAIAERPQVMLIDIGLPDTDGYELATQVRRLPRGERIVLIALTGYGQAADKRRALESGFDAHSTKPVLPEQLESLLESTTRSADETTD